MHTHCLVNVVSGPVEKPEAVLIRAVEPYEGISLIEKRRSKQPMKNWTNGPGKLTKALGITMEDYGHDFTDPPLFIAEGYKPSEIAIGSRIGIENTGEARNYPWRFWVKDNRYVSK